MAALVAACSGTSASETVLVSAASSLAEAFTLIEDEFEVEHPDLDVVLNLAGSSTLREQILEGAPADVFASADVSNMEIVATEIGVASPPVIFTTNRLQIAVPQGNPGSVDGLDDFDREDLLIGLCNVGVPCGDFAREALALADVVPDVDTNEPDVRSLLTKVEAGELDAGITYVTDVVGADSVEGVVIPNEFNVVAEYPIAILEQSPNPDGAAAFVDFVTGELGQTILTDQGFSGP